MKHSSQNSHPEAGVSKVPGKWHRVNILSFVDQMVSFPTPQLCQWSAKAAIDKMQMNESGHAPIKLYWH